MIRYDDEALDRLLGTARVYISSRSSINKETRDRDPSCLQVLPMPRQLPGEQQGGRCAGVLVTLLSLHGMARHVPSSPGLCLWEADAIWASLGRCIVSGTHGAWHKSIMRF